MLRFNDCAERYVKHAGVQREMANWLAEWLPDKCGDALEFGPGEGMFTRQAWPHFDSYTAVDIAERMVGLGQKSLPNINWQVGNAWKHDPSIGCCDTLMSSSLAQWSPDPYDTIKNWKLQLRSRGRMLHGFYVNPSLPELYEFLDDDVSPLQWYDPAVWINSIEEAGLLVVRSESIKREFFYPDALALLRSLHGIGAVRRGTLSAGALRRIIREYDERYRVGMRGVVASWTFFRVECQR
ncbi:MAG: methyltransferase domain-containing protein [Verrucomicrobiota bacterium]